MILESNEREFNNQVLRIDRYDGYDFILSAGIIHYTILTYSQIMGFDEISNEPILDDKGNHAFTIFKVPILSSSIELPIEIVNQWGADDNIIFDWLKSVI